MDIKNDAGDRFAAKPGAAVRFALFYGPDAGLVSERAARFATAACGVAATIIRLDSDAIAADPAALADEVFGLSLFAEHKAIRIRVQGNRPIHGAIEPLLPSPPETAWVIVEAGDLKKTAPLRRLFESSRNAAAVACYPDSPTTLDRLISDSLAEHGLTIGPEAKRRLAGYLGADRLITRSELGKLALYASGRGEIDEDDIRALVGDGAAVDNDDAVTAAASGEVGELDRVLTLLAASNTSMTAVAGAALRHFQSLHGLRSRIETGASPAAVLDDFRPPLYGPRRAALEGQLSLWSRRGIETVLGELQRTIGEGRQRASTENALIATTLLRVARAARARAEAGRQPA